MTLIELHFCGYVTLTPYFCTNISLRLVGTLAACTVKSQSSRSTFLSFPIREGTNYKHFLLIVLYSIAVLYAPPSLQIFNFDSTNYQINAVMRVRCQARPWVFLLHNAVLARGVFSNSEAGRGMEDTLCN